MIDFANDISSSTIAVSMIRVGLATQPVINLMRDALLDAKLIYCDETTLQVLKEEGCRPQTTSDLRAQMTGSGAPIRGVTYTSGRGTKLGDKLFTGIRTRTVRYIELVVGIHRYDQQARAIDVHLLKSILRLDHGQGVCARPRRPEQRHFAAHGISEATTSECGPNETSDTFDWINFDS